MTKIVIDLSKLYDLDISQYAYILLLYTNSENAYRLVGISDDSIAQLVDKKYLDDSHNLTEKSLRLVTNSGVKEIFTPTDTLDEFIEKYRTTFPAGINSSGYPYRGDKQSCIKKMRKFMKLYPKFTEDVILRATKEYVHSQYVKGYQYMQTAAYLIEKDGVSNLAGLCENALIKQQQPPRSGGFELDLN